LLLTQASISAHAALACPSGTALNHTIRLTLDSTPATPSSGAVCSPNQISQTRTADGGIGAIGVASGNVGAAAAAGVLSAKANSLTHALAFAETQIEFTVVKVDDSLPNFLNVQIGYDVEVLTIQSLASLTDPAIGTLRGRGFANFFQINDLGQMISAGGVPVEHRNGVPISLGVGNITPFGDDSVTIEVGRLSIAAFGVDAFTQLAVGGGLPAGSGGVQLHLAVSGVLTPPPGYAIEYTGAAPSIGAYPLIENPFMSLVPLPGAVWFLATGLIGLAGVTQTRVRR
jgi:hypothetical protein